MKEIKKYSQKRGEMPKHPTHKDIVDHIRRVHECEQHDRDNEAMMKMREEFDCEQRYRIGFAVILLMYVFCIYIFLSSTAGAHHGDYGDATYRLNGSVSCNNCDKLGNSLRYRVQTSPFAEKHPPIAYTTLVWPTLPTTAETLIKIAEKRLTKVIEEFKREEATKVAPDWESFWTALALVLWAIGLILLLIGTAGVFDLDKAELTLLKKPSRS